MSSMSSPQSRRGPSILFILFLIIAGWFFIRALVAVPMPSFNAPLTEHAQLHGDQAVIAQACFQNNGTMKMFVRRDTGRTMFLCQISETDFAISLKDPGDPEPFNYFTQKKTTLEKVLRWVTNGGYEEVPPGG